MEGVPLSLNSMSEAGWGGGAETTSPLALTPECSTLFVTYSEREAVPLSPECGWLLCADELLVFACDDSFCCNC